MNLKRNTLWNNLVETTGRALRSGALVRVPTDYTFIEDKGVRFCVRVLSGLQRKDEAREKQDADSRAGKNVNPFSHPEHDLTVCDITDTHRAILNKFNVVDHHLLIITRQFEEQDTLLTLKDFEALWLCMAEYDSLGFYNGGREAGASQRHKHLQLVPLPLAPEGPAVPMEPVFAGTPVQSGPVAIPTFPFIHAFVQLDAAAPIDPAVTAKSAYEFYSDMLRFVGFECPDPARLTKQSAPYCLLATRTWMLLVPRSREFFENISFNSLAFAGSLFVRNEEQLARLKQYGPMRALADVAMRKSGG
jgi:ATP adenylyltransferase